MHLEKQAQIETKAHIDTQGQNGAQIRTLLFDKALTEVSAEYSNYSNIFLAENTIKLLENTGINEHTIKVEEGKQLFFEPIYNLGSIKLEMLKIYIKTNLANGFIRPSKSPANASILFNQKPDKSLYFCVDY